MEKALLELNYATVEIRMVKVSPIVVSESASAEDQGFTLVTKKKAEGLRRGPGRPRKLDVLATAASSNTKEKAPSINAI